jgi:hypothetical protein
MKKDELRAIAQYFRDTQGANSFCEALVRANALSATGELANAAIWTRIAEEISLLETDAALQKRIAEKRSETRK